MRNYSTRFEEIDLIGSDKGVIVFVEEKAKKGWRLSLRRRFLPDISMGK